LPHPTPLPQGTKRTSDPSVIHRSSMTVTAYPTRIQGSPP
jgi:hypothetical protein